MSGSTDLLFAEIERRGWFGMVTEWQKPPKHAIAVVAVGEGDDARCYEAESDHELDALSRAFHKARTAEDFAPTSQAVPTP